MSEWTEENHENLTIIDVLAESWNRYIQNTMSRLRYERDVGTLLLEGMCSTSTLFYLVLVTTKGKTVPWFKNIRQRKPLTSVAWIPAANQNSDHALPNSTKCSHFFNPLNLELNPICYLLAILGAHHFLHVSRIRVKLLTFRRLMSYIYGAPILDVSRSHTTTQHSR